jgi:hypothetical protein
MYWRMDEAGVRGPSRRIPKEDSYEPGGVSVLPGTYQLKMTYGDQVDSASIDIVFDPRVEMQMSTLKAQQAFQKSLEELQKLAGEATTQILQAQEIADFYQKQLKEKDKEAFKESIEASKAIKDSLELLIEPFVGKDNSDRQGIIRSPIPDIGDRIGTAGYYVGSSLDEPGPTGERLKEQAEEALTAQIETVNTFFETEWKSYQEKMKALDISPFKEFKKLD